MLYFVGVQKLSDNVWRLQESYRLDVVLDGPIEIIFGVQMVAVLPEMIIIKKERELRPYFQDLTHADCPRKIFWQNESQPLFFYQGPWLMHNHILFLIILWNLIFLVRE